MKQGTFGEFGGGADEERPADEAAAVAGNGGDAADVVDLADQRYPDADGTVECSVTQVDYTIEGSGDGEHPVLHVFGRTAEERAVHVRVYGFRPYFYTPLSSLDLAATASEPIEASDVIDSRLEHDRLSGPETYADREADGAAVDAERGDDEVVRYESIRGEDLVKVFGQTPRDVGQLRERFEHYEADILFPNRLLIDKDITSGVRVPRRELEDGSIKIHHSELETADLSVTPRVHTLDIEVDDRHGFPEDGEETIICLTSHDSGRDEYVIWLYESPQGAPGPAAVADYDPIGEDSVDTQVRVFDDEAEMLVDYLDYVDEETDPDVITGWNCLPADSEVLMADGSEKEIEDVEIGDQVVGSENRTSTIAEVTNKWESEKPIYEFELADGTSLRSSGDHKVMVGDEEQVDWKRGRDIEPGEYVLKPRKLEVSEPTVPTLVELISDERQRFTEDTVEGFKDALPYGAATELSDTFDISKGTLWKSDPTVWSIERCRTAAEVYDVPLPDGGRVAKRTEKPLERELTAHELYLAGLVLTDGSMSQADGIRFYNTREELHEEFPGESPLVPDGKGCYKQNVLDFAMMRAFHELGVPYGDKNSEDVDLSRVYSLPELYIASFLAGAVDGDGNVASSVSVSAVNTAIGHWYVKLFRRLGIYAEQTGTTVRIPDAARDVGRFKELVLPHMNHSEKVSAIEALEPGKSGRSENIPYALFEADIGSDEKRIGNDKHRRGINLKRHETTSEEWEDWVFVEVEDIDIGDTETTYDIETTTHNFFAEGCLVHNCDDFDAPYLVDRIDRLAGRHDRLDRDRLSRVDEVWDSGWGGPDIKGRVVFDLLYAYQRTQFSELDSYRLDAVGEEELGVGKERYAGDIGDLWESDPERLLEYNLRDVELCVELDRKQDIVQFWEEVASFVGCKLEDATTPGDAVDMYVLHKVHGDFALPSKGQQESEDYEGGAVFDPITGVKEMVSVLDLKCFSEDTDVATPNGLENIRDLEVGDMVYTLNPETFECEVKPVVDTQSYDNQYGELHHVTGNTYDFKVTENHRFLLSNTRGWDDLDPSDFEFTEFRNIPNAERFAFPNHEPMAGATRDRFRLDEEVKEGHVAVYAHDGPSPFRAAMPEGVESSLDWANGTSRLAATEEKTGKYLIPIEEYREHRETIDKQADEVFLKYDRGHAEMPVSFSMEDWLELVGWFVTEGSFTREVPGIVLHQQNEDGREQIRELLDRLELNYSIDETRYDISNTILYDWFLENCGDGYGKKRLPEWVFELDATHLRPLLETLVDGDGSRTDSGLRKFWTKSDQLKTDIVRLAIRCGEKPTVSRQADGTWYVSIGNQGSMNKDHATVEEHDGSVHCVTAKDNHVVLAGRNGHLQWVGQSLYPMCMVTINASPETKVDPESYDDETYVAPNGTHFRKEPDGVIRAMVDELLAERERKKQRRNENDPGSDAYDTYDRQQAAVKVIMNCFTPDTDVLTPAGVRNIRDLEVGDEVYSLDPDTMEMEVKPVVETQAYPNYRGELIDIETSKIDFSVTPNHRMLVRKNETNGITEDGWSFVEAGDLDRATNYELPHDWDGPDGEEIDRIDLTELLDDDYEVWVRPEVHGRTFTTELGWKPRRVPKADVGEVGYVFTAEEFEEHREYVESVCERSFVHRESGRKWIPRTYDGDDFLDLLAWYITEGNVYTSEEAEFDGQQRGSATTVKIAQNTTPVTDGGQDDHSAIGELLDRMGFDCYVDERSHQFTSRLLGKLLERLCGAGSFDKHIPEMVFDASTRQKERFLETLIAGDGDRQVGSWRYTTSSERLRDDVLRLCTHLGRTVSYTQDSGSWRIHCTEDAKNTLRMHRSNSQSSATEGVYCVTVEDNHTLLAGRNGKFQFVGQSLYGVLGWDRFRLYDKEMGAAVTATGRDVIEFTADEAAKLDKDVIYGDTDSIMLELGGDVSKDDAIEQSLEIESHINDAYDDFAEQLNAHTHRFQIEFEKLYRRFFQAGKKKRYAGHIVWSEGKDVDDVDITGFEYKRSDIAPITKEVQHEVLQMIVRGEDTEDIKEYVHDVIQRVQAGEVSLDEIGIPGGIGKKLDNYDTDTAQVRGAKYANLLLGTNFASGSKPKRLYLKKVHPEFFREVEAELGLDPSEDPLYGEFKRDPDVICFEYDDQVPDAFEVDYEKMLEKTLKGPIARVLEALDVSWDEVRTGQEQTDLGSYM